MVHVIITAETTDAIYFTLSSTSMFRLVSYLVAVQRGGYS